MDLLAQEVAVLLSLLDLATLEAQSSALSEGETRCTCCFVPSQLGPGTLEVEVVPLSGLLDDTCRKDRLPPSVRSRRPHMGRVCELVRLVVCNNHSLYPTPPEIE